jgi:hypothetical protein
MNTGFRTNAQPGWLALAVLAAVFCAVLCLPLGVGAQATGEQWIIDFVEAVPDPENGPFFASARLRLRGEYVDIELVSGRAPGYMTGRWEGPTTYSPRYQEWTLQVDLGSGLPHNLLLFQFTNLDNPSDIGLQVLAGNRTETGYSADTSIPMMPVAWDHDAGEAAPVEPTPEEYLPPLGVDEPSSGFVDVCETYCLNGYPVESPYCDCAPSDPADDSILSLVIGLLTLLGVIGGGGWVVTRLVRRRPKARPRPAPPAERVLVDALGRKHVFVRDEQGRYINPQTGGELNEAQWDEYNRNLVDNRKFSDQERQKLSARDGAFDREMDQMVEKQRQVQRDLHAVQQLERNLLFNPDRSGLWRGPGEPGDMYTNLKKLREQLSRGEEVDRRRLDAVRRLYRDHAQGTILTPDEMPSDMDYARDVLTGTLDSTLREIATQQNSDGGFSWKAMGLRLLANVATFGQIEMVLTPLESAYTMHDYVQGGGDSAWEGFTMTAGDVIKGEIMSWLGEAGGRRLARLGKPKPQLPRARTPKAQLPSRYAKASGVDIQPHMAGMPEANIHRAQQLAQKHNVQIMVRPTNPEARALLERGLGRPKPMMIKNKTISHVDTLLGANADDLGKVGHFKPKLPPKNSVLPELYEKVKQRYVQRFQEFRNQAEYVTQIQKQGKAIEHNGVLYEVLADGTRGKPFCGDHDLFEILDAHGNPCPESLKQHVLKELKKPPFNAQHPPHTDWDYSYKSHTPGPRGAQSPYEIDQGIDNTIRQSHGPGGEPLIKFQPGTMQPIEGSYYVGA